MNRPLRVAAVLSLVPGAIVVGFLAYMLLRNGTHASYCPAASAFWIFRCLPTPEALLFAAIGIVMIWVVAFPLIWIVVRGFVSDDRK
jgi:hypothetical protein